MQSGEVGVKKLSLIDSFINIGTLLFFQVSLLWIETLF